MDFAESSFVDYRIEGNFTGRENLITCILGSDLSYVKIVLLKFQMSFNVTRTNAY